MIELFPDDIFSNGTQVDVALDTVNELYSNLGEVEDDISAYVFYEEYGTHTQQQVMTTHSIVMTTHPIWGRREDDAYVFNEEYGTHTQQQAMHSHARTRTCTCK